MNFAVVLLHSASAMKHGVIQSLKTMLIPPGRRWSSDVANFVLSWKFSSRDARRMRVLAAKANEGELTSDERTELQAYCDIANVIGIAQSKARQTRRRQSSAA